MNKLAVYLDNSGYGLLKFNYDNENRTYTVIYLEKSKICNCRNLAVTAKSLIDGVDTIYFNDSDYLYYELVNNIPNVTYKRVKIDSEDMPIDNVDLTRIEGYRVINTMVSSQALVISKTYSSILERELKGYSFPEDNPLINCLFIGIAKHELVEIRPKLIGSIGIARRNPNYYLNKF